MEPYGTQLTTFPVFCDTENSDLVRYNHTLKLQTMIPGAVCDGYFHVTTEDFPRFARAIADAQRFMRRELKSASAVSQRDIIRVASWVGIGADFSVASG